MPTSDGETVTFETLEVGKDEADKKLRGDGWNPLFVQNMDPAYSYRWLNKNKLNLAKKVDYMGYELVSGGGEETVLHEGTRIKKGADLTSQIEVGDLVLARIPKDKYNASLKMKRERLARRTQGVAAEGRNAVNKAGGANLAFEEHFDNRRMREDGNDSN